MGELVVKLDRFKPRDYQIPIFDALENKGYKRIMIVFPRRAGKDLAAFNVMIRAAIKKVGVYYYIFPTYSQAKKAIWDSITNDGVKFLDYIPEDLVVGKNSQEMKITLINDSIIQFVGSTDYDRLMGTNPRGVIFSEYALQDPRAYKFMRPILTANNGWAIFVSCVSPNTLVIGKNGIQRIKDVSHKRSEYSDLNVPIYGLSGFHNAEQFYYGGKQKTLKITLMSGYQIECTPVHPLWDGIKWIKAQCLKIGDVLPIQYGQDVWGEGLDITSDFVFRDSNHQNNWPNLSLDSLDFFYLIGLIHADGNYTNCTVCVTNKKDPQIIEFLHSLGFKTRKDGIHHEFSSKELCRILEFIGFKHGATNKTFPERLFDCTKEQMASLLSGIFDGDGCSASGKAKRGYVKLTSTCADFMCTLQVILLNFGIVSSLRKEEKAPTKLVNAWSTLYNIEIYGYFANIFYRDIGFRLERKQKNWANIPDSVKEYPGNKCPMDLSKLEGYIVPLAIIANSKRTSKRAVARLNKIKPHKYLDEFIDDNLFYSKIRDISYSMNDVYDFVIPDTHSFFSNGFLSHNTPRGKHNALYDLYQIALQSDDWFTSKLTIEDTKHISMALIDKERKEGIMSEDLIQQEYFTSFDLGIEGGYYTKIIDKLRREWHVGNLPLESGFQVNTAWDIGRDSTAIIFFQLVGKTIRIVDCYENSKEDLEFYVHILREKGYIYDKHIGPHDLKVSEWGAGLTRIERARQLGVNFIVADSIGLEDGIESVRATLPKMWFDEKKCGPLLKAIENYRQEYDIKKKIYHPKPLHNWASHFADALRYLSISLRHMAPGSSPEDLDRRYREARYGADNNMPKFFR